MKRATDAMRRFLGAVEERTGFGGLLRQALDEHVPGGARWSYVFGSALVALIGLQALTGVLLAFTYTPSTAHAWGSVWWLQNQAPLGWFLRGLHAWGASAMVVLVVVHLVQVVWFGAYKAPREANWFTGLALGMVVMAFGLTGYLLPWDQKGFWATRVATNIAGTTPVIGKWIQRVMLGGDEYGTATLTRFFAVHVLVLPAAALVLVALHLYLFRRHGVTPSGRRAEAALAAATEPFWPGQAFRDSAFALLVVAVVAVLAAASHGTGLEAPADPSSDYLARPEWYFLPLFQLLKYFEGPLEPVGTLVLPTLAVLALVALPFIDRGPSRDPRLRRGPLAIVFGGLAIAVLLTVLAVAEDRADPDVQAARETAERQARYASVLAARGIPAAGGLSVYENDPEFVARRVLNAHCFQCHRFEGKGGDKAPDLTGFNSRANLRAFMQNPDSKRFFGNTEIHGMDPVEATGRDLDALVELIASQAGESAGPINRGLVEHGRPLFEDACSNCHSLDGVTPGKAPNHGGRGSHAWLVAFLRNPAEARFFGEHNAMPAFADKLTAAEIEAVAGFLGKQQMPAALRGDDGIPRP